MPIEYNINLDVGVADTQLILNCKNTDTARSIAATFHNGGTPIMLTSNNFAVFVAKKPDGNAIINDCTVDLVNNCVRYDITPQTVAAIGTVKCEIHLFDVLSSELASPTFNIVVRKALASETGAESSEEYKSLTGLYAEIKTAFNSGELHGITPLISYDGNKFTVSYDKGLTYEPIVTGEGTKGLSYDMSDAYNRACDGIGSSMDSDIYLASSVDGKAIVNIKADSFRNNTFITSVTIPSSYKYVRNFAFGGCTSLTKVDIADSVTMLNYGSFSGCTALKSIRLPSALTAAGGLMLSGCTSLMRIYIPQSMPLLPIKMLYGCTALMDIFFGGTKAEWSAISKESEWNNNTGEYTIHCTDGDLAKT